MTYEVATFTVIVVDAVRSVVIKVVLRKDQQRLQHRKAATQRANAAYVNTVSDSVGPGTTMVVVVSVMVTVCATGQHIVRAIRVQLTTVVGVTVAVVEVKVPVVVVTEARES